NVTCNPNTYQSHANAAAIEPARKTSKHLEPRRPAYRELWLHGERIAGGVEEVAEATYGTTYMPRTVKTIGALPPSTYVALFRHGLGSIEFLGARDAVAGRNAAVGCGMGMPHGQPDRYPRVAAVPGYCRTKEAVAVAEAVVTVQRGWGDRVNRKHPRLKYTIE